MTFGSDGFNLYVDGVLSEGNAYTGGLDHAAGGNTEPIAVGASTFSSDVGAVTPLNRFFAGRIDEVAILGDQLTASDIAALYEAGESQGSGVHVDPTTDPDTVGFWRLGEPSGPTAFDAAGSNDGAYTDATLGGSGATSDGDSAAEFNGTSSQVDLGNLNVNGTGITMSAWINPDDFGNPEARIVSKATGTDAQTHDWMLSTATHDGDNVIRMRISAGGVTDTLVAIAGPLQAGAFQHVAGTYDAATGLMSLYLDGELVGQTHHSVGGAIDQSSASVWIGANPDDTNHFDGRIDEVAVIERGLSASEVAGLANRKPTVDAATANQSDVDGASIFLDAAAAFNDLDGDDLDYTVTGLPTGLKIDAETGLITRSIATSASQTGGGVYTVTVTADDGNGGTVDDTFTWTVTNPAPVANNDTATAVEDVAKNINVLGNDTDDDALTVTAASAANGTVVIEADGTLTYTSDANFNGSDTITYTVTDADGATGTAQVAVTVQATNDDPTVNAATADQTSVDGASISLDASAAFDDLDGDDLDFTVTGLPAGLSIDAETGLITGSIATNASQSNGGIYTVTVTADDGNGGTVDNTFTWAVTNPAPVANNDTATAVEDVAKNISVLANDIGRRRADRHRGFRGERHRRH